jgi:hypothetical protein
MMHANKFKLILDSITIFVFGVIAFFFIKGVYKDVLFLRKNKMIIGIERIYDKYSQKSWFRPTLWHKSYTQSLIKYGVLRAEHVMKVNKIDTIEIQKLQKENKPIPENTIKKIKKVVSEADATFSMTAFCFILEEFKKHPTDYRGLAMTFTPLPTSDFRGESASVRQNINSFLNKQKHKCKFNATNNNKELIRIVRKQGVLSRIFNKEQKDKNDKFFFPLQTGSFYLKDFETEKMQKYYKTTDDLKIYREKLEHINFTGNVIIIEDMTTNDILLFYQNSQHTNEENNLWSLTSDHLEIFTQNSHSKVESRLKELGIFQHYEKVLKFYETRKKEDIRKKNFKTIKTTF